MVQSKLGVGNYASLSGFSWPTDASPNSGNIADHKRHFMESIPFSDVNINMSSGSENSMIGLNGQLFTEANLDSLKAQVKHTELDDEGEITDYPQRLYFNSSTKFFWVSGASFTHTPSANNPTSWPYTMTLLCLMPFKFYDGTIASGTQVTTNTTATISGAGINNAGSAYVYPYFEIANNAGANITAIKIEATGNSRGGDVNWSGTLESGKSIRIVQEYNPELGQDGWTAYKYDTTDFTGDATVIGGLSGNKAFLDPESDTNSFDFTLTGNNNTANVWAKFRERDY